MLPMMTLQPSDTASFDNSGNSAELLTDEPSQGGISFAAFFESGLEAAQNYENMSGALLPPYGNQLPVEDHGGADGSLLHDAPAGRFGAAGIAATLVTGNPAGIEPIFSAGGTNSATIAEGAIRNGRLTLEMSQIAGGAAASAIAADMESGIGEQFRQPGNKELSDAGLLRQLAMSETQNSTAKLEPAYASDLQMDGGREFRLPQLPVATSPVAQPMPATIASNEGSLVQTIQASTLTATPQLAASSSAEPSPLLPTVDVAVKSTGWGQQIGERVLLMTNNRLQNAEIRLTPAELGPVRVQLAVEDGAASVTFLAQNAITRDALEQAMPRLRELLAENGLDLSRADVSEHGEQNGAGVRDGEGDRDDASPENDASPGDHDNSLRSGPAATEAVALSHNGLVDTFV